MRGVCGVLSVLMIQAAAYPPAVAASMAPEVLASVSLETLMAEALARNPAIRAARQEFEAARLRIPLAKGLPAPRIGVEFEDIPRGGVKLNQATILYSLIQSLPFPGKLSAKHRVAVAEAGRAAMAFKQREWEVVSQVKEAYYGLWLAGRDAALWQEQQALLHQAASAAQSRYASGSAMASSEVLSLQSEELEAANAASAAAHRRAAVAAHLNHLLNRPAGAPLGDPEPPQLAPLAFSAEELVAIARERQPELLTARYVAERAAASSRLAKRELVPDLETMFELRDPAMGPVGPWDLTLAVAVPFWFWTKWRYGLKIAVADEASARAAYEAMAAETARRIYERWHGAQAAYATATLCEDHLIGLSRQAAASALSAYQAGRGAAPETLDALRRLAERRRTYAEHAVAYVQEVAMLEEASGVFLHPEHRVEIPEEVLQDSVNHFKRGRP